MVWTWTLTGILLNWLTAGSVSLSVAPADTLLLPVAVVSDSSLRFRSPGTTGDTWAGRDISPAEAQDVGQLLQASGGIFLKSYGAGGSSTLSVRGAAAAQSTVLWNGLPITHPMLGQLDLSLMPAGFFDRVRLESGGQGATWGSGAIGGVIRADQDLFVPGSDHRAYAGFTAGAFGFLDLQAGGRWSREGLSTDGRLFRRTAVYDFPYRIRDDLPEKRQTHAQTAQTGWMQTLSWFPHPRAAVAAAIWLQAADRDIPPTTVQNRSVASQQDAFGRFTLQGRWTGDRILWTGRFGWFREDQSYEDPLAGETGRNRFRVLTADATADIRLWSRGRLMAGLTFLDHQAEADVYTGPGRETRLASFISLRQTWAGFAVQGDLRREWVDGYPVPWIPSIGMDGPISRWVSWTARAARNYRLPTLNDRYWVPGGRTDIRPESGWSVEAGIRAGHKTPDWAWQVSLTAYHRLIDDWILWSPISGEVFWSPRNLTRVRTRGLESRCGIQYHPQASGFGLDAGYDRVLSTVDIAVDVPRMDKGDQLIYTPKDRAFISGSLRFRSWEALYRHSWTGSVTSTNAGRLDGYAIGSASLRATFPAGSGTLETRLDLLNCWNTSYRVIERRPMPGRESRVSLFWTWSSPKKT